ncbi:5-hydroxyisourate hydrolase [Mycoplana sp. BE70]|uniref:hydroxyisourate hydrolase n=1 Tax=Mycoplana sp. BE70 TaxID=2817775 RepID=UPI00285F38F0|nr:hydroxyisourate hydrolase [Mycoplana sp. BE70]MDR6757638.1 5-hydroxyisourate hydrolase [Mycoplana sp. BE70]
MTQAGRLTTHVLDTALGKPAEGLTIELFWLEGEQRQRITTVKTNSDGRVDGPLVEGIGFMAGTYELLFHAGDYLRRTGVDLPDPAFLDIIPLRFGIANPSAHYHVPLLLSPFGYSTYRGS